MSDIIKTFSSAVIVKMISKDDFSDEDYINAKI